MVGVEVAVLTGEPELHLSVLRLRGLLLWQAVQFVDQDVLDAAVAGRGEVHRTATGRLQPLGRVGVGESDQRAHRAHTVDGLVGEDLLRHQRDRRPQATGPLHQPVMGQVQIFLQLRRGMLRSPHHLPQLPRAWMCGDLLEVEEDAHHLGAAHHQHALADETIRHGVERFSNRTRQSVRADAQFLAHHPIPARHRERSQGLRFRALEELQRSATDLLTFWTTCRS